MALLALACASVISLAQTGGDADLVILALDAHDTVFEGEDPATVTALVKNVGSGDAQLNEMHFHYNTTDRRLTGDSGSDQPFNTTGLPPGDTARIEIAWEPGEDQRGPGTLVGVVESQTEPAQNASDGNRAEIPLFVESYAASLTPVDEEPAMGFPGHWLPFPVELTNTGNVATTYHLETTGHLGEDEEPGPEAWALPEGWRAFASQEAIELDPGDTATIVALVQPNEQPPQRANASINASITADNFQRNVTTKLPEITVTDPPDEFARDAAITPVAEQRFLGPDPGVENATWRLTNTGTETDAYNLTATVQGPLEAHVEATPPSMEALDPGESLEVNVTLNVDEAVPVGANGTLHVEARSVDLSDTDPGVTGEQALVGSGPNLVLEDVEVPEPVYSREGSVLLPTTIANEGNLPAPATNVTVRVVRSGFVTQETSAAVPEIAAGDSTEVAIGLSVSELTGSYVLEIEANQPAEFDETRRDDNALTDDIHVRSPGVSVVPADPLQVTPGDFARFVQPPHLVHVVNQGNAREPVQVHIESEHGWFEDNRSVSIDPGAREGIPIELDVPRFPGVARDEIHVSAHLVNMTDVEATNATILRITDEQPPTLENLTVPDAAEASQPFTVSATFRDALGVQAAWVTHTEPDGTQQRVDLSSADGERFQTEFTLFELGTHSLRFHAHDRAEANNTFDGPRQHEVQITYTRVPTIELENPETGALRSGDPIDIAVEDPVGLSEVNASVLGRDFQLQGDMSIDTTGWREGTFDLTVRAANRYGLANSTVFPLTVDNTPPQIASVSIEPEDPAPGEQITITADVQGDADAVEARLETDEGSRTTVPLNRSGDDGHVGHLTLPAGTYTVDVHAVDAAGNVGSTDGTRTLSVGNSIPSLTASVLLALLACTAAIRSRADKT